MEEVKIDYMKQSQFGEGKNKLWFLNDLDKILFGDGDWYAPTADEEENTKTVRIRKYMSLENALNLLDTEELYLANPTVWADSFESLFIQAKYEKEPGNIQHFNDLLPESKHLYCTCFTSGYQSDAQWSMYNDGEIGIMIDFDAKKLFEKLSQYQSDLYIGKAKYIEGGWQAARNLDSTTRQIIKDTHHKNHSTCTVEKYFDGQVSKSGMNFKASFKEPIKL